MACGGHEPSGWKSIAGDRVSIIVDIALCIDFS